MEQEEAKKYETYKLSYNEGENWGTLQTFGETLWKKLYDKNDYTKDILKKMKEIGVLDVDYSDSYILSPQAAALTYQIIKNIPGLEEETSIHIKTVSSHPEETRKGWTDYDTHKKYFHWFESWEEGEKDRQKDILKALFDGYKTTVTLLSKGKFHERKIIITLKDGQIIRITGNKLAGDWRNVGRPQNVRYNFDLPAKEQAKILKTNFENTGIEVGKGGGWLKINLERK